MSIVEVASAETYLKKRRVPYSLRFHPKTFSAAGEARILGIPGDHVLKVILLRTADGYVMAILEATDRIELKRVAHATGDAHVRLATEDELLRDFPTLELGAIPPLPGLLGVKGYVDPKVVNRENVAFADGRQTETMVAHARSLFWGEDVVITPISKDPDEDWRFEGDSLTISQGW